MEKQNKSLPITDSNIHQDTNNNSMSSTEYEYNPYETHNEQKRRIEYQCQNEINQLNNQVNHAKHSRSTEKIDLIKKLYK